MKTTKLFLTLCILFLFGTQLLAQPTSTYTGKPMFQVLTQRGNVFLGTFTVELFPNIAPKHVRNFDSLVSVQFYDSLAFHRVVPGFVIQGGGPYSKNGPMSLWGVSMPGQSTVPAEFSVAKHSRGILSAARVPGNINSATSQFFVCVAEAANLNGQYSVYGRVTKGMNYVDTIVLSQTFAPAPSSYSTVPWPKITMFITYIGSNDTVPNAPTLNAPLNNVVGLDSALTLQLKWNKVNDAIIYHLDLSTDSLFVADTIMSVDNPNLYVYKNNLKGNTRYYWRVRANNGGHFSPYSQVWNFHTAGETTGISSISKTNEVVIVYPNPSSSKFTFENLEIGSKFEMFDPSGRLIVDTSCKESSMILNMERKDRGEYTYRIICKNGSTQSGKLLLQ